MARPGRPRNEYSEPTTSISVTRSLRDFIDRLQRTGETVDETIRRMLSEAARIHRDKDATNRIINSYFHHWKEIYERNNSSHQWELKSSNRAKIWKRYINELQTSAYQDIPEHAFSFKEKTSISEEEINKTIRQLYDHIGDTMGEENFPVMSSINEGIDEPDWVTKDEIYCFLYHYTKSKEFFVLEREDSFLAKVDLFSMRKKNMGPLYKF